ncbi:hypothetical protein GCM10022226_07320 [Sphaerisporangium flaviroseum]|uniref:ESX-1 secretion-associated protein n=1 Tax=Sphaerisporangium flaviroseum TaxID=509199 RepID=A0ABP7HCD4_9ACTN
MSGFQVSKQGMLVAATEIGDAATVLDEVEKELSLDGTPGSTPGAGPSDIFGEYGAAEAYQRFRSTSRDSHTLLAAAFRELRARVDEAAANYSATDDHSAAQFERFGGELAGPEPS